MEAMKDRISKAAQRELEAIRKSDPDGLLRAESVVKFAKAKTTALHGYFCWDNTEAARRYRLEQAKYVIRVCVRIIEHPGPREMSVKVRNYVSLPSERGQGTYRSVAEVVREPDMHAEMLEAAMAELRSFKRKYAMLRELKVVFDAIDKATVRRK